MILLVFSMLGQTLYSAAAVCPTFQPLPVHQSDVSHVCTLTGYQCYKRRCGGGAGDSEAALEGDQEKVKDFALDNNAYENDEEDDGRDGDREKSRDSGKNTKM